MSGYLASNETAFIESKQYSKFILTNLDQVLLPTSLLREVADFGSGEELIIKTTGSVVLGQGGEDTPPVYQRMDTGTVTLTIDQYPQIAWSVSDVLREDGTDIQALHLEQAGKALHAIGEYHETTYLAALNTAQVAGDPNNINGVAHRKVATGTNEVMSFEDFVDMDLAFNEAGIPTEGRVAIVTPRVAATMNLEIGKNAWLATPWLEGLLETSIVNRMQFVGKLFNFNIFVSTRLPDVGSETVDGASVDNAKANMFLSVVDDNHKALMGAWRRRPQVRGEYDMDMGAHKYLLDARFGVKPQRVDTIGIVLTDNTQR